MPGSDGSSSYRSELLSDAHGLPVVAICEGRITKTNAPARALFQGIRAGIDAQALFDERCRAKAGELLSRMTSGTAELQVSHPDGPVGARFLLLTSPSEQLLIAVAVGIWYAEAIGEELMAANSELARLTRELARRVHELDAAKRALLDANETERRLRAELERLTHASSAVAESLTDMPSSDVSAVLYMVAHQAQSLANADYVALGIGSDEAVPFEPWVFLGFPKDTMNVIGRAPRPVGALGCVARDGEVLRVDDVRRHERFQGLPPGHPEVGALLGVPIRHRGRSVGNLYLARKPGATSFSEQDERLIRMLTAKVAVAIETALLYASQSLQRAWLQNIIDQMPDGVLLYDEHGHFKAMNQAFLAFSSEETDRTDPFGNPILLDPREPDGSVISVDDTPLVRAFRDERATVHREMLLRRRDGSFVPVAVSAVPVRASDRKISGVTMIIRDISARKELERLREEWAAIVAHDLRQPVTGISSAAELLLRRRHDEMREKDWRQVERIKFATERLSRMICDLSDRSQLESNRLSIEPTLVDLGRLIGSVVEGFHEVTAKYPLTITGAEHQLAWIDPDRIQQVLDNLISNAAKYGEQGTEIRVEVVPRDVELEVIVTNRGPGIPPDQLPLLFNRFSRTTGARESGKPGLGLGLYIAKGLVEAHGGRIWVESKPAETTSFHFTVPREPPPRTEATESGQPAT